VKQGLLKYSDISNLQLSKVVNQIRDSSKIRYGDIKLSDLLLSVSVIDLKICDYDNRDYYGSGVYVFFDGDIPVYVGKADNFLQRLSTHRSVIPKPGWGWNSLLLKICITRLFIHTNHTKENFLEALAIVEKFKVIRILLDSEDARKHLVRFERILMKGINYQFHTLLN
jgi:hypothetical protein